MADYYTKTQVDAQATVIGARIKTATVPATLKTNLEAVNDTNFMTDAEKAKLAALDTNRFFGTYANLAAIPTVGAEEGMYAHIDSGATDDVHIASWDTNDNKWIDNGVATAETAAGIKVKYESNADTNVFTDAEKSKLAGLVEATGIVDFTSALDAALA